MNKSNKIKPGNDINAEIIRAVKQTNRRSQVNKTQCANARSREFSSAESGIPVNLLENKKSFCVIAY